MTRTIGALADRLVGVLVPTATAEAACTSCFEKFCYCSGPYLYKKYCCYTGSCSWYECGNCRYVGRGC